MTSRERVKKAIHFQDPDHVPHCLPDGGENDLLWLWMPGPEDIQPWTPCPDAKAGAVLHEQRIDPWGVVWEKSDRNSMGEAVEWPVSDITRQAEYKFPNLNAPEYFEDARANIEFNNRSTNPKYCLGVMPFSSLNESAHSIMGLQAMFCAYCEHPHDLKALIQRLAQEQQNSIRMLANIGCDGVMGYDDWGLQDRLMVSLDIIKEFFLPFYRENWTLAHDLGMDVWIHSCGNILDLLPHWIDAGLNVVQMDQQENMGLDTLNQVAGGRLAFWCPVDIQNTMVRGSIDDIRNYVQQMIDTLGGHRGGLISMAYSSPKAVGHPQEKTDAMCAAFRSFGIYK